MKHLFSGAGCLPAERRACPKPHSVPPVDRPAYPLVEGRGFSLIELLVSMALGLIVVLAITGVLVRGEGSKQTMTTTNDMSQTGAYVSYLLDRTLRSAGSGYVQRWKEAFGCALNVRRSDLGVLLPRASALPAPFAAVSTTARLAPVIIGKGAAGTAGDVLTVMTGSAGYAESPSRVVDLDGALLTLPNLLGLRGDDLVLLADGGAACMLQQVSAGFTGSEAALPLAGTYYAASSGSITLDAFKGGVTFAIPIGSAAGGGTENAPLFQLVGVGDNATLVSYDLLRLDGGDAPVPIADGVTGLRALYGVDTSAVPDGKLDGWFDPGTAPYRAADLLDGSPAAQTRLRGIVAIRVALVLRSPLIEKENVSPNTLTLFGDQPTPLKQTVALSTDDRKRRFRVVDFTVPLRNLLLPR